VVGTESLDKTAIALGGPPIVLTAPQDSAHEG